MAEAWTRHLKGDIFEAYSAGTAPKGIDPRAVKAMAEVRIDISRNKSKSVSDLPDIAFDYVVTLCDDAQQSCPFLPAKTGVTRHPFDNPPKLAEHATGEEEAMDHYRRVRDEIKAYIEILPSSLDLE